MANLERITWSTLVFVSPQDHVVDPSSTRLLAEATSGTVEVIELEHSYHVATLDYDRELINTRSVAFANACVGTTNAVDP